MFIFLQLFSDFLYYFSFLTLTCTPKFLSESRLRQERNGYGWRVRDCHAEVLARRAFCRRLFLEILEDDGNTNDRKDRILVKSASFSKYRLKPGITLHLYCSSAPCGNATLKKFSKMTKNKFRDELGPDQWPREQHQPIHGHSIKLGQFALLVKKDNSEPKSGEEESGNDSVGETASKLPRPKGKPWPAMLSDDWTPPGTTIVTMNKGSIHTCSDKILRWNLLGLQGTLLASLLESRLYLSTVTVGRKFNECICRRAVCCRIGHKENFDDLHGYHTNHPAILCTAVYMGNGAVKTNASVKGQDVRFHSSLSWAWWPNSKMGAEWIDGATGFLSDGNENTDNNGCSQEKQPSLLCTQSLLALFFEVLHRRGKHCLSEIPSDGAYSLTDLRKIKMLASLEHEKVKEQILTKHRLLRQWSRRSEITTASITST